MLIAVAGLLVAGTGAGCDGSASEDAVRSAINGYVNDLTSRDAARTCAAMTPAYSRAFLEVLTKAPVVGSCTVILKKAFGGVAAAARTKVEIRAVTVDGDSAHAQVGTAGKKFATVQLTRSSGRWLVACCTGSQRDSDARRQVRVPSGSMEPTFKIGRILSVDQRAYTTAEPRIGDIVVMHPPLHYDLGCAAPGEGADSGRLCARSSRGLSMGELFLKRVVAGPGDRIALRSGRVILNGHLAAEPFIRPCSGATECDFPTAIVVPPDTYYVLGDNRGASDDSRFWGPVPRAGIIGRVILP